MNNKILVTVYVPLLDENFDVFIPVNKKVGTVKNGIVSSIKNLAAKEYQLMMKNSCELIDDNIYVKNSDINNGCKLILL